MEGSRRNLIQVLPQNFPPKNERNKENLTDHLGDIYIDGKIILDGILKGDRV
jgi:hypothetical protein